MPNISAEAMEQMPESTDRVPFGRPCYVHLASTSRASRKRQRHGSTSTVKEPRAVCTICGKGFKNDCWLQRHMRSHTGEKPYKCRHCGRQFSDASVCARHERLHDGGRPFACTVCGKSYTRASHLKQHRCTPATEPISSKNSTDTECPEAGEGLFNSGGAVDRDECTDIQRFIFQNVLTDSMSRRAARTPSSDRMMLGW